MARSRNIKPGFFSNDELAEIDFAGRLLFAGLWTLADREGRLEDRPKRIKGELFPYDDVDVDNFLAKLADHGFISRYEVSGSHYIQITNFKRHQNPHQKEPASKIPALYTAEMQESDLHQTSTVQAPEENSSGPADSLNLIPDSLNLIPETTTSTLAGNNNQDKAEFVEVVDFLTGNICMVSNQVEVDLINDWLETMPRDWITEAIKQAALSKARSIKYVDKILQAWVQKYSLGDKPWEMERHRQSRDRPRTLMDRAAELLRECGESADDAEAQS